MSYEEFLMRLECIAIENGLRLTMTRSELGSGFFFYFVAENDIRSDYRVFLLNHMKPEELFEMLERVAKELKDVLKGENQ